MNEEELNAKQEELAKKEGDLAKKEDEIKARESALAQREADTSNIAKTIKEEFEARLEAQKAEFEQRLKDREDVIRQLSRGEDEAVTNPVFDDLNKSRLAQKVA